MENDILLFRPKRNISEASSLTAPTTVNGTRDKQKSLSSSKSASTSLTSDAQAPKGPSKVSAAAGASTAVATTRKTTTSSAAASGSFASLGLASWVVDTLSTLSITIPTDIQQACIPPILQGRDVAASAKTGSGKTAAFGLPILQRLSEDIFGIHSLILTPTRELAFQIGEQMKAFGQAVRLQVGMVVGGLDMMKQAVELHSKPHCVVATPGRLADLLESSPDCVDLTRIRFLVLDEADRLLEASFHPALQTIYAALQRCKRRPQTLLFSATLTKEMSCLLETSNASSFSHGDAREEQDQCVESSSGRWKKRKMIEKRVVIPSFISLSHPFVHHSSEDFETVSLLCQKYILVPSLVRETYLIYLLRNEFKDVKSMIIFAGRCKTAEMLRLLFHQLQIRSTALHSYMNQHDRMGSLAKFKSAIVPILITTDVGSRGLDIPSVQLVIHYDMPADPRDYIHRIGRTARAGRGGLALSIVGEIDTDLVKAIEMKIKKPLEELVVPEKEVLKLLKEVSTAKREASMMLSDAKFGSKQTIRKEKING